MESGIGVQAETVAIKKTMIALGIVIFLIATVSAWTPIPDSISYFPLVPGSYWIYQDSVYNPADAEDIGTSTLTKDSIINRTVCDSGYIVNAAYILYTDGKRKAPVQIQYYCDTAGYVFKKTGNKNEPTKRNRPRYKVNPRLGDSCYLANRTIIYNKDANHNWFFQVPNVITQYESFGKEFFAKGIGFIGCSGPGLSTNLIEYRIGDGPVIKKHWLMEAPVKK
jgi:hypothetical protein